jgi:type IV secretion system protein VirB9
MKRVFLLATGVAFLVCAVIAVPALANEVAPALPSDHRIRSVLFTPNQVVRLRGWVGYHIDVEFEPGETFATLGGGDLDALSYGSYANHLVLKPKAAVVHTNLTVITSRRTYILDYAVNEGMPDPFAEDLVYSLRFTYPAIVGPTPADRVADNLAKAEEQRSRNFDYWFCGNPLLQPIAASDDGVHTRVRFAPRAELPAIFVRSDEGTESLLNFSMDAGDVIIHRTARRLILRRGRSVGCIVNKGYTGAGERLPSGTVSPHVRRGTPEIKP